MKKHFNAQGEGLYRFGYPECGEKYWYSFTTIPSEVTCERCKKTQVFKKSLTEQMGKDGDKT